MRTILFGIAVGAIVCPSAQLWAQTRPTLTRDSVRVAINRIAAMPGHFGATPAAGDFSGDHIGFEMLSRLMNRQADSVLTALVDCVSDSATTKTMYHDQQVSRGGLCYLALHNLIYRETSPESHWPGNYFGALTPERLLAAQAAWREAIRLHSFSIL